MIVIGSGPGGVSAADAFRQHDPNTPALILTADLDPPYARPPLSKEYLRGDTADVALHPSQWYADRSLELRLGTEVDAIDPIAHTVSVGRDTFEYTSLVLACGAAPVPLSEPGGQHALHLRSLADARRLRRRARDAHSAVIIGAGFIGCEVAASLALRGIAVTLVAPDDVPQEKRLGRAAGTRLRALVTATGARYLGGVAVCELDEGLVKLDDGTTIGCDLIVAATGVSPRIALAEQAGVLVEEGRVVVGADMRSSVPDVYAVGDLALAFNAMAGRRIAVEHWQDADDQGAVAGANAAGETSTWQAVPGFWSTIGDATVKYHAWGDGYEHDRSTQTGDGFSVWYEAAGAVVGVLTHNSDDDYDAGGTLIAEAKPVPTSAGQKQYGGER